MPKKKSPRKSSFPSAVKRERKRLGLTQKELAKKIDTTENTIARWERGESIPIPVFEKAILTMLRVFPGHDPESE